MDITCPFALPPPRHVEARVRIYEEETHLVVNPRPISMTTDPPKLVTDPIQWQQTHLS